MVESIKHIAFIMDGNGRWAASQGLSRLEGHQQGVKTLQKIVEDLIELKIPVATFYAFSSENWGRPEEEVSGLISLFKGYLNKEIDAIDKKGVSIRFLGDMASKGRLDKSLVKLMKNAEEKTKGGTALHLNMCINYGGQDEITRAVRGLAENVQAGNLEPNDITVEVINNHLDTTNLPAPDLCIRTGGEKRLSNFMLWQLSYAELFFTDTFWPAFSKNELEEILISFNQRQRRFGRLPKVV